MDTLRHLFLKHVAQTSTSPLALDIARAEGIYLYDTSGKRYADLISGIGVSSYGHGNQHVIKAIQDQAGLFLHTMVYGEYVQKPQVLLAEKLCSLLPPSLSSVYFVNSGAEATEGAMKLAKRATGRNKIIAMRNAYHGSTQGALSLMSSEYYTAAYRPLLPQVDFMDFNSETGLEKITSEVAAVFVETIQGEAGYIEADLQWLVNLRKKCDQTGTLLVLDEIQCGMGRTGKMFAFEHYNIVPDILLLAKALGAGMPLGAFIASGQLMKNLADNPVLGHITTFGGHPVCCAAALAGLEFLEKENLVSAVTNKENLLREKLQNTPAKTISGKGLMLGVDLGTEEINRAAIAECINRGVITDWFLHCGHKMRIAPPLTISDTELEECCNVIVEALDTVTS